MNIKRLIILTGTILFSLTLVSMWLMFLSGPPETVRAAGPWYVAPGGSDSNSCLSTGAPCATINGAIGKATGGDTIFVATGTYTGTGDEVVLIGKDITLSGGWDGSFTTQSGASTIDGEDGHRGITMNNGVTAIIDYFTIQNGYSVIEPSVDGGGIVVGESSTLTLTNSIVNFNTASDNGGGIMVEFDSKLFLESSTVSGNSATLGEGGGIKVDNFGSIHILKSWIVGNAALNNDAGGIGFDGGSSAFIENSIIAGNFTDGAGGGLRLNLDGPYHIVNSHIVGNKSLYGGAAIDLFQPSLVEVTNTLVISNTGSTGIDGYSGAVILLNYCNTYGNSPDGTGDVTITRNNCLGSPPEDGLEPMMAGGALPSGVGPDYAAEWLSYDYHLLPGSPAIDAGTPVDAPATDIEGNPRDATPDLGAFEIGFNTDPIITSITPNVAVANTGDLPVTISGFNFSTPISAQLNGVPLLNPTLVSDTTLNAVVPVNSLEVGLYDLTVTVGGETDTLEEAFTVGLAGPWYVTTNGDDGDNCLSPATSCATINGALNKPGFLAGSNVLVATGEYTGTGGEVVLLNVGATISGGWDASFATQSGYSTIDGEDARRGVFVNGGVTADIDHFTIQNGYSGDSNGSGIMVHSKCELFLESSVVSGNACRCEGGGIKLHENSSLNMSDSWVVGNTATLGGGIHIDPGGSSYIENSIIAGNTAYRTGGGLELWEGGPYRIINSHIIGNEAENEGAAIATRWGPSLVELTNTLVISNTGITGIDDKDGNGSVFLLNYCDTYGNSPDGTSGVTITRNNCLGTPPEDGLNPMMAGGTLPSGVGPDYADEWLSYDYRLLPDSPAIDAGTPVDAPSTDIEGTPRDANPDLGAYEMGNTPPSISGAQVGQHVDDNATIDPFTTVTISDPDDDTLTVIVSLNNANKGDLTNLGGFVEGPSGTYTFVGSPSSATTAIHGLTFIPTENRKVPGGTDTTIFTISADDGTADPVTDDNTTVIATSINDLPTINGTLAGQTVDDNANIAPFSGVTIADPDKNAQLTVIVSLDDPAKGVLTNLGGFVEGPAGTYTYDCSPSEATTAIQGLIYYPTAGRVPVGQTETTTFTISADDSFAAPVTDDTTTVIVTAVGGENTPPSISGTVAGQTVDDNTTIDPFTAVTITDPDTATITVTVSLDDPAKGDLVNLGGFVEGPAGTYTFTGSPAEATTAIRALTFDPTEDRVPVGQTETTTFTISADDDIADPVTDDTTTVIVTAVEIYKRYLPLILR